jgi:hypothetical protein
VFPATSAIFIAKVLKNGDFWPLITRGVRSGTSKSLFGGFFEFSWKMLL